MFFIDTQHVSFDCLALPAWPSSHTCLSSPARAFFVAVALLPYFRDHLVPMDCRKEASANQILHVNPRPEWLITTGECEALHTYVTCHNMKQPSVWPELSPQNAPASCNILLRIGCMCNESRLMVDDEAADGGSDIWC